MPGSTAALPLGPPATAAPWRIVVAFAAIYVIWGSTYLAIRIGIGSVPPFVLASVRFLVAGAMLYVFARWRGAARPTAVQWRSTAIIGGLLLLCGNGGVVWSETRVSSGIAALLVAVVPLWMALFDWIVPGGQRPTRRGVAGLLVGLAGVVILAFRSNRPARPSMFCSATQPRSSRRWRGLPARSMRVAPITALGRADHGDGNAVRRRTARDQRGRDRAVVGRALARRSRPRRSGRSGLSD
ncbi:MAG: EamA family transporter [Phycisphaerae bacterium]